MYKYLIIAYLFFMCSCDSKNHYLINCCNNSDFAVDHDGILYLVESGNYESLQYQNDSLRLKEYLSNEEMKHAFDTTVFISEFDTATLYKTEFVLWDTLLVDTEFVAELVLLKENVNQRGYCFQIRTYDKTHKLISIQDFATWVDEIKKYCSGDYSSLNKTFIVTCGNTKENYKFDKLGRIIFTGNDN